MIDKTRTTGELLAAGLGINSLAVGTCQVPMGVRGGGNWRVGRVEWSRADGCRGQGSKDQDGEMEQSSRSTIYLVDEPFQLRLLPSAFSFCKENNLQEILGLDENFS